MRGKKKLVVSCGWEAKRVILMISLTTWSIIYYFTGQTIHLEHGYLLSSRNVSVVGFLCCPSQIWWLRSCHLPDRISLHGGTSPSACLKVNFVIILLWFEVRDCHIDRCHYFLDTFLWKAILQYLHWVYILTSICKSIQFSTTLQCYKNNIHWQYFSIVNMSNYQHLL